MIREATIAVLSSHAWLAEALTRLNRTGNVVSTNGIAFARFTTYESLNDRGEEMSIDVPRSEFRFQYPFSH